MNTILNFFGYLFPKTEDLSFILDYFSHLTVYPERRLKIAPILLGPEGVGKSLLLEKMVMCCFKGTDTVWIDTSNVDPIFFEKRLLILDNVNTIQPKFKEVITENYHTYTKNFIKEVRTVQIKCNVIFNK